MPRPDESDNHFAQACAIEMHMEISHKPFYAEICRKKAAPLESDNNFVRVCAGEMHMDICTRVLMGGCTGKIPRPRT